MDWKEYFKHSLVLFGFMILFGILYLFITKIFRQLKYTNHLWVPAVVAIILIPLIYSIFIKKSVKELTVITILLILISSIISLPIMNMMKNSIRESKGDAPVAISILEIFSINPMTLIDSPVCAPYTAVEVNSGSNENIKVCQLKKYGFFAELIIVGIVAFIITILSMMLGSYVSRFKR